MAALCGHLAQDSSTFLFRSPRHRIDFQGAAWLKRVREAQRPPQQPLGTQKTLPWATRSFDELGESGL